MSEDDSFQQQLQSELHKPVGPFRGWDAVNRVMIRHWCEVLGDTNPVYTDPDFAERTHSAIVAPPTMLQSWTMRGYNEQHPPGSSDEDPFYVLTILEQAGYPAVVAVNCDQEYFRYLREGDTLYHMAQIESISEEKTTALGRGYFVTQLCEYFTQNDEKVGTMRFRVFKYQPHEAAQSETTKTSPEKPQAVKRMRPVRNYDTAFFWEGVDDDRLLIQHCKSCDTLRHPPAPACPQCQSLEWDTVESSGRGEVYSFVVMHHPPIPPFDYPNVVALVELEEGTRLITQLVDIDRRDVRIGLPVEVVFEEVEEGLRLPLFRPKGDR